MILGKYLGGITLMINTVALMGRLVYEPELKTTPSGVSVIQIVVASDRNYQPSGKEREADFVDVVAWRNTAEFISRNFHKGSMIAIEGTIQTRTFTDKNGNNRKATEVVANQVSFCGGKEKATAPVNNPAPAYAKADSSDFEEIVEDDDCPFL